MFVMLSRRALLAAILVVAPTLRLCAAPVTIGKPGDSAPRLQYGIDRLIAALRGSGIDASLAAPQSTGLPQILVGGVRDPAVQNELAAANFTLPSGKPGREGFVLLSVPGGRTLVAGADDSGTLYGCLELARRVQESQQLPTSLRVVDQPAFVLRGSCIGLQKTYILPGRKVYEYPYTRELFPFLYDKAFWREYLDLLAENRMNTLYLWAGHPFASLVKLTDYPYALEVSEEQFAENVAMYRFIADECDRRGIWLVQMFYNILLSKPFAEKNHLDTQLRAPTPLAADYTRKSIAEFVKQYPHVGLMVCLGEALQGTTNQTEWATKVILPGVHDGMRAAGLKEEPPIVFRTHAMDAESIMPAAFKVYSNLFTETKYNGESLTTWEPRGKGQATHLAMAALGPHLVNIHILSNLEPFRYGDTEFIRKSMLAARDRLGATGLHLYPLSYWNWPDAPDKLAPAGASLDDARDKVAPVGASLDDARTPTSGAATLKQWDRDWIWFEAWARYAWSPDRDPATDRAYWVARIRERFGTTPAIASRILAAYNDAGEVAPRIIRRFGITEGNRQTMSLGMTLDQLVHPEKYGVLPDLWESQSPPGERLQDYVEKEFTGESHAGETPPSVAGEIDFYSGRAVSDLAGLTGRVTKNQDELARLRNDVACIRAMAVSYIAKTGAAYHVLRYLHNDDVHEMELARDSLRKSLQFFSALERLTRDTYYYANSMQTAQRRIPFVGGAGGKPANFHWTQVLPLYEKEYADFDAQVTALQSGGAVAARARTIATLRAVPFEILTRGAEAYTVKTGARVFTDSKATIEFLTPELEGLKGIRLAGTPAPNGALEPVEIAVDVPVRVLIGYVKSDDRKWRRPPSSETDAAAAARGGTEPLLVNAVKLTSLPNIDVYDLTFDAGHHVIDPAGSGAYMILGVVAKE